MALFLKMNSLLREGKPSCLFFEDLKVKMVDLPKLNLNGKIRKACEYYTGRYVALIKFLDYSYATSSNQKAENTIRPFVIGRKNWFFCITAEGAEVSALYYPIVETCKLNVDSVEYLTYLFMNTGSIKDGDVKGWRNILPGYADTTDAITTSHLFPALFQIATE